ncbi:hypothetical protein TeGR_g10173, partial [Tetraparma gracilis]
MDSASLLSWLSSSLPTPPSQSQLMSGSALAQLLDLLGLTTSLESTLEPNDARGRLNNFHRIGLELERATGRGLAPDEIALIMAGDRATVLERAVRPLQALCAATPALAARLAADAPQSSSPPALSDPASAEALVSLQALLDSSPSSLPASSLPHLSSLLDRSSYLVSVLGRSPEERRATVPAVLRVVSAGLAGGNYQVAKKSAQ